MTQIAAMAAREGLAVGAWLGEAGVRSAQNQAAAAELTTRRGPRVQELMLAYAGLMDVRRILRNVGGNLNDVARHANSTGILAPETAQVQALVARVVARVDTVVAALLDVVTPGAAPGGGGGQHPQHPQRPHDADRPQR